jgi:hypothetical protein
MGLGHCLKETVGPNMPVPPPLFSHTPPLYARTNCSIDCPPIQGVVTTVKYVVYFSLIFSYLLMKHLFILGKM